MIVALLQFCLTALSLQLSCCKLSMSLQSFMAASSEGSNKEQPCSMHWQSQARVSEEGALKAELLCCFSKEHCFRDQSAIC